MKATLTLCHLSADWLPLNRIRFEEHGSEAAVFTDINVGLRSYQRFALLLSVHIYIIHTYTYYPASPVTLISQNMLSFLVIVMMCKVF